jgi:hypothetical protein
LFAARMSTKHLINISCLCKQAPHFVQGSQTACDLTVWRALKREGFTFKKKKMLPAEQERLGLKQAPKDWRRSAKRAKARRLIFIDETGNSDPLNAPITYGAADIATQIFEVINN